MRGYDPRNVLQEESAISLASWLQQWLALLGLYSPCFKVISDKEMVLNLTFTTLRVNSTDQLDDFFFFSENMVWRFMQTVSLGDSLHEMLNPVFWNKSEKYFKISSFFFFASATGMCNYYFYKHLMKYCRGESYHHSSFSKRLYSW